MLQAQIGIAESCPNLMWNEANQALCQRIGDMREATPEDDRQAVELIDKYLALCGTDPLTALSVQTTEPFKQTPRFNATVLHVVCELGLIGALDRILELCADPALLDLRMDDGATALFLSQISRPRANKDGAKALYMATRLVGSGADCFISRVAEGAHPLYTACQWGFLDAAKFLLSAMLASRGITEANRTDEALQEIVHKEDGKQSLLHAAVCRGKGYSVCRWLTSPECALLWPGRSRKVFLDYMPHGYPFTAFHEAASSDAIDMPTVRYLYDLGNFHTAAQLLDKVAYTSSRRSDCRITPLRNDVALIDFLYEKAALLPDFVSLEPTQTLWRIVGWFGAKDRYAQTAGMGYPMATAGMGYPIPASASDGADRGCSAHKALTIAKLVKRIIARYPQLFKPDHVLKCKKFLGNAKAGLGMQKGEASRLSVMIMLDWYPFDCDHLRTLISPGHRGEENSQIRVWIDRDVFSHYIRQFLARADCGDVDHHLLCDLMDHESSNHIPQLSATWTVFASRMQAPRPCLLKLTQALLKRDSAHRPFAIEHMRFILWARDNGLTPRSFALESLLYRCLPSLAPAFMKYLMRVGKGSCSAIFPCLAGFHSTPQYLRLLDTMVWNSSMRPTQFLARVWISSTRPQPSSSDRVSVVRRLKWIYNLRHMIKERGTRPERIVLGPKNRHNRLASALPSAASRVMIELLWEGTNPDLILTGLTPIGRQRVRRARSANTRGADTDRGEST